MGYTTETRKAAKMFRNWMCRLRKQWLYMISKYELICGWKGKLPPPPPISLPKLDCGGALFPWLAVINHTSPGAGSWQHTSKHLGKAKRKKKEMESSFSCLGARHHFLCLRHIPSHKSLTSHISACCIVDGVVMDLISLSHALQLPYHTLKET